MINSRDNTKTEFIKFYIVKLFINQFQGGWGSDRISVNTLKLDCRFLSTAIHYVSVKSCPVRCYSKGKYKFFKE